MMRKIEDLLSDKRTIYNIDGTKSDITKRVGFCNSDVHRGYLTKNLMEKHECIEKECPYFIKYEKNTYWKQKEASKKKRQQAKEERKIWEQKEKEALYIMRDLTKNIDDFAIVSAQKKNDYIDIRYVTLVPIDLSYELFLLKSKIKTKIKLSSIKNTYSKRVELLKIYNPNIPGYLNRNINFEYNKTH